MDFLKIGFLVLLTLPDEKILGRPRGEWIWKLLSRIVVKPFPVQHLVANLLRGKSKKGLIFIGFDFLPK